MKTLAYSQAAIHPAEDLPLFEAARSEIPRLTVAGQWGHRRLTGGPSRRQPRRRAERRLGTRTSGPTMAMQSCLGDAGTDLLFRGREAWALMALLAASVQDCTPIDNPARRWSGYVHDLRRAGVEVETAAKKEAL